MSNVSRLSRAQPHRRVSLTRIPPLVPLVVLLAAACDTQPGGEPEAVGQWSAALQQTCTAQDARGNPIRGVVCGGSSHALYCTPGALYQCDDKSTFNNCTLSQACTTACITVPGSSLRDQCWTGTAPVQLSTQSTLGGNSVTATVTLTQARTGSAINNFRVDRGDLVGAVTSCNVLDLPAGVTSVSFAMPTAVVSSATTVSLYTDLAYSDTTGASRQLVSVPKMLTLNPGGTAPPPPALASFTLSPSTIGPGGVSFMDATLTSMAPMPNVPITVTSSDPSTASVITGGQPVIQGGCTTGGGAATIAAAKSVPQQTTVTISASSGAAGSTPITNPLTVTAGCQPLSCIDVTGCGSLPDGCGGTITCGCSGGQTCGGGGTPGVCGTPPMLSVASLTLSPTSVVGGSSSTATVTLTMPAPSGGAAAFLSSSSTSATVPDSVVIAEGQTSATFTVTTAHVSSTNTATISASLAGTKSAALTITP
jgi:hypothetical protein